MGVVVGWLSVIRPRRMRRGTRRRRGSIVEAAAAVVDRAVLAVARLHPTTQGDEILVRVDDGSLGRLRRFGVVFAIVEGNPTPSVLLASAYLWPRQSTTHSIFLESPPAGEASQTRIASPCSCRVRIPYPSQPNSRPNAPGQESPCSCTHTPSHLFSHRMGWAIEWRREGAVVVHGPQVRSPAAGHEPGKADPGRGAARPSREGREGTGGGRRTPSRARQAARAT